MSSTRTCPFCNRVVSAASEWVETSSGNTMCTRCEVLARDGGEYPHDPKVQIRVIMNFLSDQYPDFPNYFKMSLQQTEAKYLTARIARARDRCEGGTHEPALSVLVHAEERTEYRGTKLHTYDRRIFHYRCLLCNASYSTGPDGNLVRVSPPSSSDES